MTDSSTPERRGRSIRAVAVTWMGLISLLTILNFVVLSHVGAEKSRTNGDRVVMSALQERLASVEQALQVVQQGPRPVNETRLIEVQTALEGRLTHVEQLTADTVSKNDFTSLHDRIGAIEARLDAARQARANAQARTSAPATPQASELPFVVLGSELRGGERFLAVAPTGASELVQVHLLRVGDVESAWRLESLEGKSAAFKSAGRVQRIEIP